MQNGTSSQADVAIGYAAFSNATTASNDNVVIGNNAGLTPTASAIKNIIIGSLADASGSNGIAIGYNVTVASNTAQVGNTSQTAFIFNGSLNPGAGLPGTTGQALVSQGSGAAPQWLNTFTNTFTTFTVTQATNPTTSVTANVTSGVILTFSETLGALSSLSFTVTDSKVLAGAAGTSQVNAYIQGYSGTYATNGFPDVKVGTVAAGSFVIIVNNYAPVNALSGTLRIGFTVN